MAKYWRSSRRLVIPLKSFLTSVASAGLSPKSEENDEAASSGLYSPAVTVTWKASATSTSRAPSRRPRAWPPRRATVAAAYRTLWAGSPTRLALTARDAHRTGTNSTALRAEEKPPTSSMRKTKLNITSTASITPIVAASLRTSAPRLARLITTVLTLFIAALSISTMAPP